jgi:hypothetical protein
MVARLLHDDAAAALEGLSRAVEHGALRSSTVDRCTACAAILLPLTSEGVSRNFGRPLLTCGFSCSGGRI